MAEPFPRAAGEFACASFARVLRALAWGAISCRCANQSQGGDIPLTAGAPDAQLFSSAENSRSGEEREEKSTCSIGERAVPSLIWLECDGRIRNDPGG
ncbi:hypothetical protein CALVIDRAFT_153434 [Calocera viscosa TUFC12733]|uniref:Uncharacterized protein n=1 Tax=Calocera viscosa (strain TUFC12733) TaxID=1330018 RepID=A0A167LLU2_CALVF|nr:hypothetical protein CALVIDRAFT_153434 [Calocera viscosa TUFC12733]